MIKNWRKVIKKAEEGDDKHMFKGPGEEEGDNGRSHAHLNHIRGRRSRNKVSVGEPAEGSFTRIH